MSFFTWSNNLDIHVNAMNEEHKILIRIMNDLFEKNEKHAAKSEITKTIKELVQFTHTHFGHEEKYLQSIKYPQYDMHKRIHTDLLAKLDKHVAQYEAGNDSRVGKEFFDFLKLWLNAHIQHIDMKYGDFSQGKAAA